MESISHFGVVKQEIVESIILYHNVNTMLIGIVHDSTHFIVTVLYEQTYCQ